MNNLKSLLLTQFESQSGCAFLARTIESHYLNLKAAIADQV